VEPLEDGRRHGVAHVISAPVLQSDRGGARAPLAEQYVAEQHVAAGQVSERVGIDLRQLARMGMVRVGSTRSTKSVKSISQCGDVAGRLDAAQLHGAPRMRVQPAHLSSEVVALLRAEVREVLLERGGERGRGGGALAVTGGKHKLAFAALRFVAGLAKMSIG